MSARVVGRGGPPAGFVTRPAISGANRSEASQRPPQPIAQIDRATDDASATAKGIAGTPEPTP